MTTINGYDVVYHYETNGKLSGQHDHLRIAAAAMDNATVIAAIKNHAQFKSGQGTLVVDSIKNIADSMQQ